jgi:hypothetical protein
MTMTRSMGDRPPRNSTNGTEPFPPLCGNGTFPEGMNFTGNFSDHMMMNGSFLLGNGSRHGGRGRRGGHPCFNGSADGNMPRPWPHPRLGNATDNATDCFKPVPFNGSLPLNSTDLAQLVEDNRGFFQRMVDSIRSAFSWGK